MSRNTPSAAAEVRLGMNCNCIPLFWWNLLSLRNSTEVHPAFLKSIEAAFYVLVIKVREWTRTHTEALVLNKRHYFKVLFPPPLSPSLPNFCVSSINKNTELPLNTALKIPLVWDWYLTPVYNAVLGLLAEGCCCHLLGETHVVANVRSECYCRQGHMM